MFRGVEQHSAIDFNQIPFVQAVFETLAQHPTEASGDSGVLQVGRFYFNSNEQTLYIYTTSGWQAVAYNGKKVFTIGDGTATTYTCNHNLNTRDLTVAVRLTAAPYSIVDIDMDMTDMDNITIRSAKPLATNELTVVVKA